MKANTPARLRQDPPCFPIVAIGASTGGPTVVRDLIMTLSPHFHGAVVIVQHIDERFVDGFIGWLSASSGRNVQKALPGGILEPGRIYLAGGRENLLIGSDGTFYARACDAQQMYCPGVDVFFRSLQSYPQKGIAILLTGMGSDGALGLADLATAGWHTIVQQPESCVVSGMPDSALKLSNRHSVLSPVEIGRCIRASTINFNWRS